MHRVVTLTIIAIALTLEGCSIYLHHSDRYIQAKDAKSVAESATKDSDNVWTAMASNVEAFEPAERAALERAQSQALKTEKRKIYTHSWADIKNAALEVTVEGEQKVTTLLPEIQKAQSELQAVSDELTTLMIPQLVSGSSGELKGELRQVAAEVIEKLGLTEEFNKLDRRLGQDWPTVPDAKDLNAILTRVGLNENERKALLEKDAEMALTERLELSLTGIDTIIQRADSLVQAANDTRILLRGVGQEGWPLDKAIELLRNAKDVDLIKEVSALAGGSPTLTPTTGEAVALSAEAKKILKRGLAVLDESNIGKALNTIGDLRQALMADEAKVRAQAALRRLQRDVLVTRSEVLQIEVARLRQNISRMQERLAITRARLKAASDILSFVDGPWVEHFRMLTQKALIDRLGDLSDAELATKIGVDINTIKAWKKGDAVPDGNQREKIQQLVVAHPDHADFSFCPDRFLQCLPLTTAAGHNRNAEPGDNIFMTVRHLIDTARVETANYIRVPDQAKEGQKNLRSYNSKLASTAHAANAVWAYFRLEGDLAVKASLNEIAVARDKHLYSIHRSRVESLGWKRIVNDGAEGLEAYWAGGVKPEHVAAILLLVGNLTASSLAAAQ